MKKYIIILLSLQALCFSLGAQENKAVDVTLKGIQIGQQVPDITINNLHNYKDTNGKPATTAKISDFKGKLLILDFWATWCSPCIAMIPRMDSLQKQFGDQIQFLSVTYQSDKEVLPFLDSFERQQGRKFNLPVVTASKRLQQLFPHVTLPHFVWIDGAGILRALTGTEEVSAKNIQNFYGSKSVLPQKRDIRIAYNSEQPLFYNGNAGSGEGVLYRSQFAGYIEGIGAGRSLGPMVMHPNDSYKITYRNVSVAELFRMALGGEKTFFGKNRQVFEVKDRNKLEFFGSNSDYKNWAKEFTYCYELILPMAQKNSVFAVQLNELNTFFAEYKVNVQLKKVKCLVLKRTDEIDRIATKGGLYKTEVSALGFNLNNSFLANLVLRLNVYYLQQSPYPVVDGTGYLGRVDLKGLANMSSVSQINKALQNYGLYLQEEECNIPMVVFSDRLSEVNQVEMAKVPLN